MLVSLLTKIQRQHLNFLQGEFSMARNPETTWDMLNVAMSYFQKHIKEKENKFVLSIVDLLHVSNFKGGNASITEPEEDLAKKLVIYSKKLEEIENLVGNKKLVDLSPGELINLKDIGESFLQLTRQDESRIRGFGPSYASALMFAYFPEVLPVLDRRVLNGAGIDVIYDSQKQVKNIISYYARLIEAFSEALLSNRALSLRELDKLWFSKAL
jgi:hypothetical protein